MKKHMKVKVSSLYSFCLVVGMSTFFGMYNYINEGLYITDQQAIFLICISVAAFICSVAIVRRKENNGVACNKSYVLSLALYLLMVITAVFVARFRFGQGWSYTLKESIYYVASITMVVTMCKIYRTRESIEYLKKIIVYAAIVCAFVSYIEAIFLKWGIDILKLKTYVQERNGARFEIGTSVIVISIFVSISKIIGCVKRKTFSIYHLNIFLQCINLWFVVKTRSLMACLGIAVVAAILFNRETSLSVKRFLVALMLLCVAYAYAGNLFSVIIKIIEKDDGIMHRFLTIEYYMQQFRDNPITGTGFLSGNENTSTASILMGPTRNYYRSDVGIVGMMNEFGLIGIVWLLIFLSTTIRQIRFLKKKIENEHYVFIFMFAVYLVITCVNLIFTDVQRFMYMPLCILFVNCSKYYFVKDFECMTK